MPRTFGRVRNRVPDIVSDVLESTGSDVYAHLSLGDQNGGPGLGETVVRELEAAAAGSSEEAPPPTSPEVIARLDSACRIG